MAVLTLAAAGTLGGGASAQTVYKCSAGGKVSYSDHPCIEGKVTQLAAPAPADAANAAELARMKAELEALEKARGANEAREERERRQAARRDATLRQKCERLRLKQQWAEEDLARAGDKTLEAMRIKAKRQAQALAVECPG